MGSVAELGKRWGNAPLLWDPLSLPFVLGSRMAGSPASDRFVVFTWPAVNSGDAQCRKAPRPPPPTDSSPPTDALRPLSRCRVARLDGSGDATAESRSLSGVVNRTQFCKRLMADVIQRNTSPAALHTNNNIYSFISTAAFFRKQSSRAKLSVYEGGGASKGWLNSG